MTTGWPCVDDPRNWLKLGATIGNIMYIHWTYIYIYICIYYIYIYVYLSVGHFLHVERKLCLLAYFMLNTL